MRLEHAHEMAERQVDLVILAAGVIAHHALDDRAQFLQRHVPRRLRKMMVDRYPAAAEMVATFLAHGDQARRGGLAVEELAGFAEDVRVERPGQAAVGADQDDAHPFHGPALHQRMMNAAGAGHHVLQDLLQPLGIWPCRLGLGLGPSQPRRGDHVHRAGHLLDIAHATNAAPDISG